MVGYLGVKRKKRERLLKRAFNLKSFFSISSDLLFPNHCLHCDDKLNNYNYLCPICLDQLILKDDNVKNIFRVFEITDVSITILNEIKKMKFLGLINAMASLMVYYYLSSNQIIPEYISTPKQNVLVKDHNYYLAYEISKIFKRPIKTNQNSLFIIDKMKNISNNKILSFL